MLWRKHEYFFAVIKVLYLEYIRNNCHTIEAYLYEEESYGCYDCEILEVWRH